jgi:hypothetical protein
MNINYEEFLDENFDGLSDKAIISFGDIVNPPNFQSHDDYMNLEIKIITNTNLPKEASGKTVTLLAEFSHSASNKSRYGNETFEIVKTNPYVHLEWHASFNCSESNRTRVSGFFAHVYGIGTHNECKQTVISIEFVKQFAGECEIFTAVDGREARSGQLI